MIPLSVHPLTRLGGWLVAALALPALEARPLALGVAALALAAIARPDIAHGWWRSRWLFVSLLIVYVGVDHQTMRWGIHAHGITPAVEQIARLAIVIGLLGLLFPKSAANELVYAIYLLLKPFARIGICAERIALRIGLTMQFALQSQPGDLLRRLESSDDVKTATVELQAVAVRPLDYALGALLLAITAALIA